MFLIANDEVLFRMYLTGCPPVHENRCPRQVTWCSPGYYKMPWESQNVCMVVWPESTTRRSSQEVPHLHQGTSRSSRTSHPVRITISALTESCSWPIRAKKASLPACHRLFFSLLRGGKTFMYYSARCDSTPSIYVCKTWYLWQWAAIFIDLIFQIYQRLWIYSNPYQPPIPASKWWGRMCGSNREEST